MDGLVGYEIESDPESSPIVENENSREGSEVFRRDESGTSSLTADPVASDTDGDGHTQRGHDSSISAHSQGSPCRNSPRTSSEDKKQADDRPENDSAKKEPKSTSSNARDESEEPSKAADDSGRHGSSDGKYSKDAHGSKKDVGGYGSDRRDSGPRRDSRRDSYHDRRGGPHSSGGADGRRRGSHSDRSHHQRHRSRSRDRWRSRSDGHNQQPQNRYQGPSGSRKRSCSRSRSRSRERKRSRSRDRARRRSHSRERHARRQRHSRSRSHSPEKSRKALQSGSKSDLKFSALPAPGVAPVGLVIPVALGAASETKPVLEVNKEVPSNLPLANATSSAVTPQMAIQQAMAAMNARAQLVTGVSLPKYYNPAAMNPIKYAEQMQKRRLLWQSNKEKKEEAQSSNQWETTIFAQDQDGKMAAKFKKLMGIKKLEGGEGGSGPIGGADVQAIDQIRRQEDLFKTLDQQYEMARISTHTQRGVGLGFSSVAHTQHLIPK